MANEEHLAILKQALEKEDIEIWNQWRTDKLDKINAPNPDMTEAETIEADLLFQDYLGVDLSEADLSDVDLDGANLDGVNLTEAILYVSGLRGATLWRANLTGADLISSDLSEADLSEANMSKVNLTGDFHFGANLTRAKLFQTNLSEANMSWTRLSEANLSEAHLFQADLTGAILTGANLNGANLSEAKLSGANLYQAVLVGTDFTNATLERCSIYGISVWNVKLEGATQKDLNISKLGETAITVDDLEVAQFIYLMLNNAKIRNVIDTITSKAVLILGRFKDERKVVLDAIRDDLRERGFLPILFDFDKPTSRDLTETVRTLAHLSRFVIADLTDPSSIPHELTNIVPLLPSVPVQPIILTGNREYAMIENLYRYPWMLPAYEYESQDSLIVELSDKVIQPAQDKADEMKPKSF